MNDLTPERSRQLLTDAMVAHMAVISNGEPYVSPISFVVIEGSICMRTAPGRRTEAIAANPRVCIEVVDVEPDRGSWESVIVWGDARVVEDDRKAQEIIAALLSKYREVLGSPLGSGSVFPEAGVVLEIPIDELSGRGSGGFFSVRTRPGRL